MRLLQINGIYPSYLRRLEQLCSGDSSFDARIRCLLADRYGATQILKPVLDGDESAFLTVTEAKTLQAWARRRGMPGKPAALDILLAQIEDHRAEVIYDLQPGHLTGAIGNRLPGCVRRTICWHASPLRGLDLTAYDRVVWNFPGLLGEWQRRGA